MHYVVRCKRYADSVEISYIFHLQCWFQVFRVSRPPFWFPVEHASNRAQSDFAISSGDFGILKTKRSNVEFASEADLRPLIQWSPSLSHFYKKIIHPTFTYGDVIRQRTISGWTISKISTSLHHARFDGSRNTPKRSGKFRRVTEIFKKKDGRCSFASPRCSRVKFIVRTPK